jgi:hypothetical protein
VRRNNHFHPATRNTFFIILYSIIRWRLGVAKHLERFPQKMRKTLHLEKTAEKCELALWNDWNTTIWLRTHKIKETR